MEKMHLSILNIFFTIVCMVLIIGCTSVKEAPKVQKPGEDRIFRDNSELLALAREYEQKKQFKKALNTLKDLQSADPYDSDIRSRVKKLETGLKDALQRHLAAGKSYFKSGNQEASEKEFRMVLFLDPENREALGFLRELSNRSKSGAAQQPEDVITEVRKDYKDYIEHTLQSGESLSILAQMYYGDKVKYDIIADFNDITDVNKVSAGQKIRVPVLQKMEPSYQATKARQEPAVKPAKEAEVVKQKEVVKEAQDLLDEATTLEEGLDLTCGGR